MQATKTTVPLTSSMSKPVKQEAAFLQHRKSLHYERMRVETENKGHRNDKVHPRVYYNYLSSR